MEKIIITPENVRGLGDIINTKGANDFTKQYSTLTQTTDTVHGTTTKIFQQNSSILLRDGATTTDHNDVWNSMTPFTRANNGTTTYYQNTGSSTYQVYTSQTNITGDTAIDFELVECTSCPIQIARYAAGVSTEYEPKTFTSSGKVHIEIKEDGTYIYFNGTLVQSNTAQTNMGSIRLFIRVTSGNTANFKYKDLRFYGL